MLREAITEPSNFRAMHHLDHWLKNYNLRGITGIDTRALTRHIREHGSQNAAIIYSAQADITRADLIKKARAALEAAPDMNGLELAAHVTTKTNYAWDKKRWKLGAGYPTLDSGDTKYHVVAIDFGEKMNILRSLASHDCRVTIVPGTTTAEEILALNPDGVFLSNAPATRRQPDNMPCPPSAS